MHGNDAERDAERKHDLLISTKMFSVRRQKKREIAVIEKVPFPRECCEHHHSKTEHYLTDIIKVIFEKSREFVINYAPEWLDGQTLTCYIPELKLAINYDGIHHFVFPNGVHESNVEFQAQKFQDQQINRLCTRNGVNLVRIRYDQNSPSGILDRLRAAGIVEIWD